MRRPDKHPSSTRPPGQDKTGGANVRETISPHVPRRPQLSHKARLSTPLILRSRRPCLRQWCFRGRPPPPLPPGWRCPSSGNFQSLRTAPQTEVFCCPIWRAREKGAQRLGCKGTCGGPLGCNIDTSYNPGEKFIPVTQCTARGTTTAARR